MMVGVSRSRRTAPSSRCLRAPKCGSATRTGMIFRHRLRSAGQIEPRNNARHGHRDDFTVSFHALSPFGSGAGAGPVKAVWPVFRAAPRQKAADPRSEIGPRECVWDERLRWRAEGSSPRGEWAASARAASAEFRHLDVERPSWQRFQRRRNRKFVQKTLEVQRPMGRAEPALMTPLLWACFGNMLVLPGTGAVAPKAPACLRKSRRDLMLGILFLSERANRKLKMTESAPGTAEVRSSTFRAGGQV
jgi:hypothetical protein